MSDIETPDPITSGVAEVVEFGDEIDFREFGRLLREKKRMIGKWALLVAVVTAVVVSIMKPMYTAEATFLPPNSLSTGSTSALLGQLGALSGAGAALGGLRDPSLIYIGILGSRTVADDLIKKFDLAKVYKTKKLSQTEQALKSRSKFVSGKDTIISIDVEDHDPQRAANLANAYLAALGQVNDRIAITEGSQKRLFFEKQLEKEKDALADAEVDLARSQEKTGMIQPVGQAQLQMETIAQTQAEIASREVQLAALSEGATDQNPEVIRLRTAIGGLRAQLQRLENASGPSSPGNIQVPTSKVPELGLIYLRKARDVKYHEALYELLLRQYEAAKLDEARSAPLVQVVDTAVVPDTKSGPARVLLTLLAALLGAVIGTVRVFFLYAAQSVSRRKDYMRAHS
jgi:uncharacterized protein involved in exopolysaccharide biosynthesis